MHFESFLCQGKQYAIHEPASFGELHWSETFIPIAKWNRQSSTETSWGNFDIFFFYLYQWSFNIDSFRQNRCSKQSICREINWLQFQKASPRIVFTTLWDQWSIVYRICHQHPIFVSKYDMGHIVRRTFVKIQKACDEFGKRLFEWKFPRKNPNWHFG